MSSTSGTPHPAAPGSPGRAAPAFDLPTLDGVRRGLRDLVEPGGGILVFFKATCGTSQLVLTHIGPLARALKREERLLLAVAQEGEEVARAFQREHGLEFPVAYETAPYAVSDAYGIATSPTLIVVDGAGVVAERLPGFIKADYMSLGTAIEQALALGGAPRVLDRPEELPEVKPG